MKASHVRSRPGPGRPRSRSADKAILRAALELFIEHGIDGASFEKIAKRAAVTRATIYRRWSSREALLAEAMDRSRKAPERSLTLSDRAAPKRMTQALINALSETVTARNYPRTIARLIGSVPDTPKLMSVYWETYLMPRRTKVSAFIERARDQGLLAKGTDSEILQDMLGGALIYHLLLRPGHRTTREMRSYLRRVLHQLGVTNGGLA